MNIFFRADSSHLIGTGHISRCLKLALKLQSYSHNVEFICKDFDGSSIKNLSKYLKVHKIEVNKNQNQKNKPINYLHFNHSEVDEDASQTLSILDKCKVDILIVDHYSLDKTWEKKISEKVKKVVVIDDFWDRDHFCNILINHNYTKRKSLYKTVSREKTKLLLGPKFAMIDEDFRNLRKERNFAKNGIKSIFIYFGGTDQYNLTELTTKILSKPIFDNIKIKILATKSNPKFNSIKTIIETKPNFYLLKNLPNLAEIIKNSDLCIGGGGVTNLERLCLGLPTIVVSVADNQIDSCLSYKDDGYIYYLGEADKITKNILYDKIVTVISDLKGLQKQSNKGMELVDGNGLEEVCRSILNK